MCPLFIFENQLDNNALFFQGWGEIPRCGLPPQKACDLRGTLESETASSRIPLAGLLPSTQSLFGPFSGPFLGLFSDPFWASHQGGSNIDHQSSPFHFISICNLSLVSSLWALIFIQYLLFIEKYIYRSHLYPTLWLNFRRQPNFHIRDRRLANQCRNSKSMQE